MADVNFAIEDAKQLDKQQRLRKKRIQELLDYASSRYCCEFPKNFAAKMSEVAYNRRIPSKKVVDALYIQWLIWKPYVNPEGFNHFMKRELERMFRIHTTTTFNNPNLNEFIGNKAKLISEVPDPMVTTVYMTGIIKLNGRIVGTKNLPL